MEIAAFNITTVPLNVVPGTEGWNIHFDRIYSLGSQAQEQVLFRMPVLERDQDRGYLFFLQVTQKPRDLRIEYQDVEGGQYRQDLTVHPKAESPSGNGYVTYASIQKL